MRRLTVVQYDQTAAVVEGVRGQWRVDPTLLGQPFSGRTALLSPLDRLAYDRKRLAEIFEFGYQLEMYKPVARRPPRGRDPRGRAVRQEPGRRGPARAR